MAGNVRELSTAEFDIAVSKGVTLVDFWAPWCMPCRRQAPILDAVAATVADTALVAKVNVDNEGDLALKFDIRFIPTLLLFRDGAEIKRFSSVQDEDTLVAAIKAALGAGE